MKFGFIIPHNYGLAEPQDMVDVAIRAEGLGFDSVWVNHHVLHAGYVLERLGSKPYYDALTVLTYVAAMTRKVRLGTSVLVLPYLNPIVLAKSLATLDVMSGGRLEVGEPSEVESPPLSDVKQTTTSSSRPNSSSFLRTLPTARSMASTMAA